MNRAEIGDIRKRDIILYGIVEEIDIFLERYQNMLNISKVITEHNKEVKSQPLAKRGIKMEKFSETGISGNSLIVICAKKEFVSYERRLIYSGKEAYKDYVSFELVDALLYQKKIMLCMGTHLIEQMCLLLSGCDRIAEQYSLIYFSESGLIEELKNRFQEYIHVAKCCDVYVRSACEKKHFLSKILGRELLPDNCRIITVADYGFAGFFPQLDGNRDYISDYVLCEYEFLNENYETFAFARTDLELLKMCQENRSLDYILEQILRVDFYSKDNIRQFYRKEWERVKTLEQNADILLADRIKDYSKKECVCRNVNEWSETIVTVLTNDLLEQLQEESLPLSKDERKRIIEEASGCEVPVYPSVQNFFGWTQSMKEKKYRVVTYYNVRYMSLEEYIKYMAEYMYKVMEFMKFTQMDQNLIERK